MSSHESSRCVELWLAVQEQHQSLFELSGVEAEGTAAILESDLALLVNDVQAIGHTAVNSADLVIDRIDQEWYIQFQSLAASGRDRAPPRAVLGLRQFDTDPLIALHPPAVAGCASRT